MGLVEFVADTASRLVGGRGRSSITVPVMDGPLKPNDILENAPVELEYAGVDNLLVTDEDLFFSSGNRVLRKEPKYEPEIYAQFEGEIMSLAAGPDGSLAIGLDKGGVVVRARDGSQRCHINAETANCPTAIAFIDADTLVVCNGSRKTGAQDWQRDLLELGRSGTVLRVDIATDRTRELAGDLAYPSGICLTPDGAIVLSEAWRHRLLRLPADGGKPEPVLADLPAYPGRIRPAGDGGYWLAAFAVRSQLQEFVLSEDGYRKLMMAEVEPDYWIAPALSSGHSFKEPLQAGGVIRLGIHKPWAPTRSYGLVILLDGDFAPVASAHSRAGGRHHGVTAVEDIDGNLLVAARGAGRLLKLETRSLKAISDIAGGENAL